MCVCVCVRQSHFFTTFPQFCGHFGAVSRLHNDVGKKASLWFWLAWRAHWKEINVKLKIGSKWKSKWNRRMMTLTIMRNANWGAAHKLAGKHCFDDTQGQQPGLLDNEPPLFFLLRLGERCIFKFSQAMSAMRCHQKGMNSPRLNAQTRRFVALNWPGCQSEKAESVQNLCLINVNPFRCRTRTRTHTHGAGDREKDSKREIVRIGCQLECDLYLKCRS